MFDSNVALWQIAYAMAQIMIIITIFILLPIYIIVWIKGRIERFRS
jgi:low affinity Fe/Cu permease